MKFNYNESYNQNVLDELAFYVENEDTNVKDASYPEEQLPAEYNAVIIKGGQLIGTQFWGANGEAQYKPALMDGDSKRGYG
ncbi:MAG: hypothetical protein AAFO82_04330 [Bacteroidota bacterium]